MSSSRSARHPPPSNGRHANETEHVTPSIRIRVRILLCTCSAGNVMLSARCFAAFLSAKTMMPHVVVGHPKTSLVLAERIRGSRLCRHGLRGRNERIISPRNVSIVLKHRAVSISSSHLVTSAIVVVVCKDATSRERDSDFSRAVSGAGVTRRLEGGGGGGGERRHA